MIDWEKLRRSADFLKGTFGQQEIAAAIVLGSGHSLGDDDFTVLATQPFREIEALGMTTVAGHSGKLLLVERDGRRLLVFSGRRHLYELDGDDVTPILAPAFLTRELGVTTLVLTNASGGITKKAGSFVVIHDHINHTGVSPFRGPNNDSWGPRFPDQSAVYAPDLREILAGSLEAVGAPVERGTYLQVLGPTYETPAEVKLFKAMGADIVGMSTALEATFANAGGLRVGAVGVVTNLACAEGEGPLSHVDVMAAAERSGATFRAFLPQLLNDL